MDRKDAIKHCKAAYLYAREKALQHALVVPLHGGPYRWGVWPGKHYAFALMDHLREFLAAEGYMLTISSSVQTGQVITLRLAARVLRAKQLLLSAHGLGNGIGDLAEDGAWAMALVDAAEQLGGVSPGATRLWLMQRARLLQHCASADEVLRALV